MKRNTWAAGLVLATLAAIGSVGPVVADDQVPFKGNMEGLSDVSAFPFVEVTATGNASHLGQFTFTMPHVVNPANGQAVGTFEFVAADGDTVYGTMTGQATPTETPNVLFIVEPCTITGGTGRFAGASGSFTIERYYNRVTLEFVDTFKGTLSAPGAGD